MYSKSSEECFISFVTAFGVRRTLTHKCYFNSLYVFLFARSFLWWYCLCQRRTERMQHYYFKTYLKLNSPLRHKWCGKIVSLLMLLMQQRQPQSHKNIQMFVCPELRDGSGWRTFLPTRNRNKSNENKHKNERKLLRQIATERSL